MSSLSDTRGVRIAFTILTKEAKAYTAEPMEIYTLLSLSHGECHSAFRAVVRGVRSDLYVTRLSCHVICDPLRTKTRVRYISEVRSRWDPYRLKQPASLGLKTWRSAIHFKQ